MSATGETQASLLTSQIGSLAAIASDLVGDDDSRVESSLTALGWIAADSLGTRTVQCRHRSDAIALRISVTLRQRFPR